MPKALDLTGKRFGKLTVLSQAGKDKYGCIMWECLCDCGNTTNVVGAKLKIGHVKSCGCLSKDVHVHTHNMPNTRLYRIWRAIKTRCLNPKFWAYSIYGGRGITVCGEWRESFEAFRDWALANGYRDDLSIDRIDPNGNYCPENCRWITAKEQVNNTRKNCLYEFDGKSHTLAEWSELLGINYRTLHSRIHKLGWSIEDSFSRGRTHASK